MYDLGAALLLINVIYAIIGEYMARRTSSDANVFPCLRVYYPDPTDPNVLSRIRVNYPDPADPNVLPRMRV